MIYLPHLVGQQPIVPFHLPVDCRAWAAAGTSAK